MRFVVRCSCRPKATESLAIGIALVVAHTLHAEIAIGALRLRESLARLRSFPRIFSFTVVLEKLRLASRSRLSTGGSSTRFSKACHPTSDAVERIPYRRCMQSARSEMQPPTRGACLGSLEALRLYRLDIYHGKRQNGGVRFHNHFVGSFFLMRVEGH